MTYTGDPYILLVSGGQHFRNVYGAERIFGQIGFREETIETDDVGILRIPIWRLQGNRGIMTAIVAFDTLPLLQSNPIVVGTEVTLVTGAIRWGEIACGTSGIPATGESGVKYVEVRFLSELREQKVFDILISRVDVITNSYIFGCQLQFSRTADGPFISPTNNRIRVTVNPIVRGAGQVGFYQDTFIGNEFETIDVDVFRYSGVEGAVSVQFRTVNDTAFAGQQFTPQTGVLNWADGDATPKTISIPLLGVSSTVQFKVELFNPSGDLIIDSTAREATVEIHDLPNVAGDLALEVTELFVRESTILTVKVKRVNGDAGAVSVNFTQNDGTAETPGDYVLNSGTLNWADQDSADKSFTITINAVSKLLFFQIELNTPGGGAGILAGFDLARATIIDNLLDPPPPPEDMIEDESFENYVISTVFSDGTETIGDTLTANFAQVLLAGVIGFGDASDSFGQSTDIPPEAGFGALREIDKYAIGAGA